MSEELTSALENSLRGRADADFDEIRQLHRVAPITAERGGSLQI